MTTKTKKNAKTDDGALRAAMRTFARYPTVALRAAYAKTMGKPAADLSRDQMVKALVTKTAADQPEPNHPTRAEQAEAKGAPKRTSGRRHDPRFQVGARISKTYKGKEYVLEVLEQGFRVGDKQFRSPTAAALAVTGYEGTISGPLFWGVAKRPEAPKPAPKKTTVRARKSGAKKG